MKAYQFQIIRYLHDQLTGEFANLGVVVYSAEHRFLECKVTERYGRLSEFFGDIHGQFLMSSLRGFAKGIEQASKDLSDSPDHGPELSLEQVTHSILPKDNSALQLTEPESAMDLDLFNALHDWYERIIERYEVDAPTSRSQTDAQAWTKVYKQYFDKYGLTSSLQKHAVKTKKDTIQFEHAWKNGVWNCYQTLSLDLKSADSIKNKVYKWSGVIRELEQADEDLNIVFLTTSPTTHQELTSFIHETLTWKQDHLSIQIIDEQHADAFAAKVHNDMIKSKVIMQDDNIPF